MGMVVMGRDQIETGTEIVEVVWGDPGMVGRVEVAAS